MKFKKLSLREMWEVYKISNNKQFDVDRYIFLLLGNTAITAEELPSKVFSSLVYNRMDNFQKFIEELISANHSK